MVASRSVACLKDPTLSLDFSDAGHGMDFADARHASHDLARPRGAQETITSIYSKCPMS